MRLTISTSSAVDQLNIFMLFLMISLNLIENYINEGNVSRFFPSLPCINSDFLIHQLVLIEIHRFVRTAGGINVLKKYKNIMLLSTSIMLLSTTIMLLSTTIMLLSTTTMLLSTTIMLITQKGSKCSL